MITVFTTLLKAFGAHRLVSFFFPELLPQNANSLSLHIGDGAPNKFFRILYPLYILLWVYGATPLWKLAVMVLVTELSVYLVKPLVYRVFELTKAK